MSNDSDSKANQSSQPESGAGGDSMQPSTIESIVDSVKAMSPEQIASELEVLRRPQGVTDSMPTCDGCGEVLPDSDQYDEAEENADHKPGSSLWLQRGQFNRVRWEDGSEDWDFDGDDGPEWLLCPECSDEVCRAISSQVMHLGQGRKKGGQ
jgi:hypothetical protein